MKAAILGMNNLLENKGQIEDVPKNPRFIKDDKFVILKQSIVEDPDMLSLRELIVMPWKNKFVIMGGNMRYKAMKELGYTEAPCKILDADTPADKLRRIILKDNGGYGEHDTEILANEFTEAELLTAGIDVPIVEEEEDVVEETETHDISTKLVVECMDVERLRELFIELQQRKFVCELK